MTVNFVEMAKIVDAFGGVELEVTGEEMAQALVRESSPNRAIKGIMR